MTQQSRQWKFEDLVEQFRTQCDVQPGMTLIVHSSQKALGNVDGGVVTSVRAIKAAVTEQGTLLLPVFSSPPPDRVFKIKRTPSRVGLITEAFRRSEGVMRSLHPTHSVAAWGRRRDELLAGHDQTSGLGVDSPFHKAAKAGAQALMIGCDFTTLSLIHVAEAIVRTPYLGKVCYPGYDSPITMIDYEGKATAVPPVDVPTDSAAFKAVQQELDRRGGIRHCTLGDAKCLRFDAAACLDLTVEMLKADPAVLLCRNPRCCVCVPARKLVEEAGTK